LGAVSIDAGFIRRNVLETGALGTACINAPAPVVPDVPVFLADDEK